LSELVEFHEILQEDNAIEGDLDAIYLIPSFSLYKVAEVQTSEVNTKLASVNSGP
jgi:hypothetical protein